MDNIGYLNYLREVASSGYQDRIPTATQENLSDIANTVMEYKEVKEEFTGLLGKIVKTVIMNKAFTNPLSQLTKEPLMFGQTIESVFVDLIEAKSNGENFGDSEASSLIGTEKSDIAIEYYSKNFAHKYKITIHDMQIRTAFLNPTGIQALTQKIILSAVNSSEQDNYLITRQLINKLEVPVIEIDGFNSMSKKEQASEVTKIANIMIEKFKFLNNEYNKQGVTTHCYPEEVVIFTTPEQKVNIDVELLATSYNMDKSKFISKVIVVDKFEKEVNGIMVEDLDTIAIVCDKDCIQFRMSLDYWESFRNADKLVTNMFHHVHGSACVCNFTNGVRIKKLP